MSSVNRVNPINPINLSSPCPLGITHSVVIQWLSYPKQKVCANRNDHGMTTERVGKCTMHWLIHSTNSFYGRSGQNENVQGNLRVTYCAQGVALTRISITFTYTLIVKIGLESSIIEIWPRK